MIRAPPFFPRILLILTTSAASILLLLISCKSYCVGNVTIGTNLEELAKKGESMYGELFLPNQVQLSETLAMDNLESLARLCLPSFSRSFHIVNDITV